MPKGVHTSKRKSGSEQRRVKKHKSDEVDKLSGSIFKYVTPKECIGNQTTLNDVVAIDKLDRSNMPNRPSSPSGNCSENIVVTPNEDEATRCTENDCINTDNVTTIEDCISTNEAFHDSRDASYWRIPVSDAVRIEIIKKGSAHFQNKDGPFATAVRHGANIKGTIRHLSKEWFFRVIPNGEKVLRSWMVYSPITNNLYCFCCRLFAVASSINIKGSFTTGFQKWWKLFPKVTDHENSNEHLVNFEKWKTLEMSLNLHKTIDDAALQLMSAEKQKWKDLLSRLLDITLFLSKQNLAFRGHFEGEESANKGNFMELVKLLSKYDAVLREHILNLEHNKARKVSYLSPGVQNEFIEILGNHVKTKLLTEIKSAKYFGMMFDSTPDISHTDQMSEVIRYVKIENRQVEVKEVFLGFFHLQGKKASDLSDEIFKKLENDGLDVMMCRSQGYDNAAVMSGIHGGVQAKIKAKNEKAIFVGCIDHSINLCGQHSFSQNASCVTFFGTVEAIFSFFSSSTCRWEVLLKHSKESVKRLSATRWSAHYSAVNMLSKNFDETVVAIDELTAENENLVTRGAAQNLLHSMCDFTFLCYLFFWNHVLSEVNCTQVSFQSKGLSVDQVALKIEALRLYVVENRTHMVESAIDLAQNKSREYDIPIEKRIRCKKRMDGELASDVGLTLRDALKKDMLECLDRFSAELQTRAKSVQDVASLFEVVQTKTLLFGDTEALKLAISKLTNFYDEVSESELLLEIPRLRRHLKAANVNVPNNWLTIDFLKFIVEWDFTESLPNLVVTLKLFMTVCVSVASCERSFSKLKLIKNYLRSTMTQTRLNNLGILAIEHEATQKINFDEVISEFAAFKARRREF